MIQIVVGTFASIGAAFSLKQVVQAWESPAFRAWAEGMNAGRGQCFRNVAGGLAHEIESDSPEILPEFCTKSGRKFYAAAEAATHETMSEFPEVSPEFCTILNRNFSGGAAMPMHEIESDFGEAVQEGRRAEEGGAFSGGRSGFSAAWSE